MLYLDHSASTPPFPEVVQTAAEVMMRHYANPSSLHRLGLQTEQLIHKASEVIGALLQVKPGRLIYTSGGTESNNLAIKGIAYRYRQRGQHLITTQIEHASVYECFRQLESNGFEVTYLPVDGTGSVDPEQLREALTDKTILVSVMAVNNETGRIQPIERIGRMLRDFPTLFFHVDAVQAVGRIPLGPVMDFADFVSFSAHKFRGPKGTGLLVGKTGIQLEPLFAGGGQQRGMRSGTENAPLAVAMAKALRMTLESANMQIAHLRRLRRHLLNNLQEIPGLRITGSKNEEQMAPHIVHFVIPGLRPEVLVHRLEKDDIYVSTQSACSSGTHQPSRVLTAMGYDGKLASSGIRVSLGAEHSETDMNTFTEHLKIALQELSPTMT